MMKKYEKFREELDKAKTLLEAQIKDLEKPIEYGTDVDGFDEEADEAEELSSRLGLLQNLKERLVNVTAALEKIAAGKYGACEKCGQEITTEVLQAAPESKYCRNCKS